MSRALWFSPVLPARTDIAHYTARVMPALAERLEIGVVRPDAADGVAVTADLSISDLSAKDLNRAGSCFYNIGNNPAFHMQILDVAARHPGIVILHDRSLQDLCFAWPDAGQDAGAQVGGMARYRAAMTRWYGHAGEEAARSVLSGEIAPADIGGEFPLYEEVVHGALGVITHNPDVADEISERLPLLPVLTLPLPYPMPALPALKRPNETDSASVRLLVFGFLNPNRRVCEILQALAQSPVSGRFVLDIAGELNNRPEAEAIIAASGLADQVRIHGFVPEADLDVLIRRADLVLNLRNPSMGEASGSQLRIWANGAASAVSSSGWYKAIPEGAAWPIGIETEAADLLGLFERLARGDIDLQAMARNGRRQLMQHDPAAYAEDLSRWLAGQREAMAARWLGRGLIEAVAETYAECLPARFIPRLPARLLG